MVSIICPVYCHTEDHKSYLAEALESVAAQTYRETELVVVDDSSPIDIGPIVQATEGLPPTRVLRSLANLGHAEARNVGIRAAEGELIAFLDHDDVWLPEKLAKQVAALEAEPEAAMVFCDVEIIRCGRDVGPLGKTPYIDQSKVPARPSLVWFLTHSNCVITVSAVLVRRKTMVDIDLFDSRYSTSDDYDAWIKILARAPILHLAETLARYRLHAHNVNYSADHLIDNRLLTALFLDVRRNLRPLDQARLLPTLARKLAGRVYWTLRRR
ncbi:MAG: glycosyltransferase family 2 protein [Armatimonadota bacterium]